MHRATIIKWWLAVFITLCAGLTSVRSQQPTQDPKPVLYVVGTSHLDSQWNWTVQDTIREFVPNTFYENFKRFEQYPQYTFNYEGAIHYMWFKEYHPKMRPTLTFWLYGLSVGVREINFPGSSAHPARSLIQS